LVIGKRGSKKTKSEPGNQMRGQNARANGEGVKEATGGRMREERGACNETIERGEGGGGKMYVGHKRIHGSGCPVGAMKGKKIPTGGEDRGHEKGN